MAQHDFVPSWLNFATPQSSKSPPSCPERHAEPVPRAHGTAKVSRRRHSSSDGFFNNEPLRAASAAADDGWQQPSLLRHDSVDSAVAKGAQVALAVGPMWKDASIWQGAPWSQESAAPHHHHGWHSKRGGGDRERDRTSGHRQRNGNMHPRRGSSLQDKFSDEERKEHKLRFVDEDFPSLNPEATGKAVSQPRAVGTPAGVWENPPSSKPAVSKMVVIKKLSKEDPSTAFSAGFISTGPFPANGTKAPNTAPSVYKNLVPKPAAAPSKTAQWKPNGREAKSGLHFSGRDSAFTSPVQTTKPVTAVSPPVHTATKEPVCSSTSPVDIAPPRLKLMRRGGTDRKSEFLRALKGEANGEVPTCESPEIPGEGSDSTPEPREQSDEPCQENGTSHSFSDSDTEHLSSSLEAEHRLLKSMGWQEYPENDDSFMPLTEEELKEFQAKTEQLKKSSVRENGVLLKPGSASLPFSPWRRSADTQLSEGLESETSSSSQTSDDDL